MRFVSFVIIMFAVFRMSAQDFLFQAEIPAVDSSGYYHIFLPPIITSKLNSKFSDVRIFDKKNREIPYLRLMDEEIYETSQADELEILENDYKRLKKFSILTIHNTQKKKIDNLVLIVDNPKNSEAWINISGSDDQKMWTVLKNNARYMPELSDSDYSEIRITDLPETQFEFYKIIIFDYNKTVFNVDKVLNFNLVSRKAEFVPLPTPTISQDDTSERTKTVLKIEFQQPQYIDKLKFEVSYPPVYLRKADIVKRDTFSGRRIKLMLFDQNQKDLYLSSDSSNEVHLSRLNAKTLYLIVTNNDDFPLKFSKVTAYEQKEILVAYLIAGQTYNLRFGNSNLPSPVYDLKFFKNKIPAICTEITPINVKTYATKHKNEKAIRIAKTALWIIFAFVVVILTLISVRLFILSKKGNNDSNNDDLISIE